MGATAAYSLTGNGKTMTARRGTIETRRDGTPVLLTFHPSFLLRQPDATRRAADTALLRGDLALAARWLAGTA